MTRSTSHPRAVLTLAAFLVTMIGAVPLTGAGAAREPGAPPLIVVDSEGRLVGYPDATASSVAREVGGAWLTLPITADGFTLSSITGFNGTLYDGDGCTGNAFISPAPGLIRYLTKLDGHLVYPSHPPVLRLIKSAISFGGLGCLDPADITLPVSEPIPFDPTTLNVLVPPFRLAPAGTP
jgi:hypothetical protein